MDGSRVDGPGVWWRLSKHGCSEFGWVPLVDGDRVAAHTHRHGSRRRRTAIGRAGSGDDEQAQPAECSEGGDGVVGWEGEMQESGIRDKVTIASRLDGRRGWLGRPVVVVVVQARASKYGESKAQDGRHASGPGLAWQQQQQQAPGLGFTYLQQQLTTSRQSKPGVRTSAAHPTPTLHAATRPFSRVTMSAPRLDMARWLATLYRRRLSVPAGRGELARAAAKQLHLGSTCMRG
ncbi:hypothetical protein COCCADRAFT_27507 [Bipolaris zeicola 26-R-13]|uniref:Uncharacterized protein n=1 Tax=Cochliobolus carbonum (strain 26-R-13) TaxID=930089 RepID=W6XWM2_COCC2|nr:uncharacterized protein COCCADRAFT_27507 [Bipolaris zeicola 26-R-13]EUC31827.1 hypothetical protein COCCADRAFT_27507 [Bipolaris zeicola 26-R-13]